VDAGQPSGGLAAHRVGDRGADVAALGDVPGVAEAVHQRRPGPRDAAGVPADLSGLAGEAVASQGRLVTAALVVMRRIPARPAFAP
jgi:hypothetical protein